ncbi:hypothetical protein K3495_g3435 [Podosphaera aphanis]|nr:hypothetical protein K3495_g3435 [Podosphaera aphanis]
MARRVDIPDDNDDLDEDFPDVAQLLEDMKIARLMEPTETNLRDASPESLSQRQKSPKHAARQAREKIPVVTTPCAQRVAKSPARQVKANEPELERIDVERCEKIGSKNVQISRRKRRERTQKKQFESDSGESRATDVSDFNDSEVSSAEEACLVVATPARQTRRLVKGTWVMSSSDSDEQDLNLGMKKPSLPNLSDNSPVKVLDAGEKIRHPGLSPEDTFSSSKIKSPSEESVVEERTKVLEAKDSQRSRCSELEDKRRFEKDADILLFSTPPGSPELKPKKLTSPKKPSHRIPMTPHRPSMDAFWQQDIINEWNDEYSPVKKFVPVPKLRPGDSANFPPTKSPQRSHVKQSVAAKVSKKLFSERKHSLAETFLKELDEKITQGEISRLAASTGGIKIVWSKKLNSTAGRANWKRETIKQKDSVPENSSSSITYKHHAVIELAEKVIDDEDRLLNVLAHEFCHLANFMISNIKTNPHGKEFKAWAAKCSTSFSHRGVHVTTKHSYAIDYKYIWECDACHLEVKRHSKSVDPQKHRCGSCMGRLSQIKPVPRGAGKVCEYQLFVRENMKQLRQENPASPHKDLMGLIGKRYQEVKASRSKDVAASKKHEENGEEKVSDEDEVESVARKLSFFDLTTP